MKPLRQGIISFSSHAKATNDDTAFASAALIAGDSKLSRPQPGAPDPPSNVV